MRDDERALAVATPDQLMRLLTVCIRQDRFVEGASLGQAETVLCWVRPVGVRFYPGKERLGPTGILLQPAEESRSVGTLTLKVIPPR